MGAKRFFLTFLFVLIASLTFFSQMAIAAPSTSKAQQVQNPNVIFAKGLLTVRAKEVRLQTLMEAIGKKAGIEVSLSLSLQKEKVTVQFENVPFEEGLRAILQSAKIVNHALSYHQSDERGKIGQWVIEKIFLKEKGTSKDAPVVTPVQGSRPSGKTTLEKEPFFDKKRDRFVEVVKGEVMVRFRKGLTDEEIGQILKTLGATVIQKNDKLNIYRLKIPKDVPVSEFLERHGKDGNLPLIEPNFIASTLAADSITPNDPSFSSQWALSKIGADLAWKVTTGRPEIIIAILDTGIEMTHPDLRNKLLPGIDIVNGDPDPSDDHGHGTHVAGIIAAETNNALGIAGLSWNSPLLPVKVITASGDGAYSDVIDGIVYAADNGARVLNLSIGGYSYSQVLGNAVEYAHTKGAVIVAAGGNEDSSDPIYPAAYPNVIGTSATDPADQIWSPSNQGAYIKLSAPGTDILSATLNNGYATATGTSASTAHVSGVAALILSKNPDFSNTQVEQILYQTADDLGEKGLDQNFGYGRLNAAKALEVAGIEVHDVAVTRIRVEPQTFKVGEPTQIIVTVQNQGTFVEKDLTVKASVNDVPVEAAKKIEKIRPGESVDVGFVWIPTIRGSEQIEIMAQVEAVEDEAELEDNTKKVRYNYVFSTETDIVTLYKFFPPVHQWIALQAYNKLQENSPLKNEIKQFLPVDANSRHYSSLLSIGDFPTTDLKAPGDSSIALIEGTWEEDLDVIINGCFNSHYWDPEKNVGMEPCNSALKDALEDRYGKALFFYRSGMLDQAYYWLGRTAHLLMDMSVPAHTLLDNHGIPPFAFDDSYEDYTGSHYKEIHSGSLHTEIPIIKDLPLIFPHLIPDPSDGRSDLAKLFYNLAEKSNNFDSDDINGKSAEFGNGKFRFARKALTTGKVVSTRVEYWGLIFKIRDLVKFVDYDVIQNDCEYRIYFYQSFYDQINNTVNSVKVIYTDGTSQSITNLDENLFPDIFEEPLKCIYQRELQARAIGYVAALYQLFWEKTHPASGGNLPPPNLISPENNAPNVSTTPTFSWSAVTGANLGYRIAVATSSAALPTDPAATTCSQCVIMTLTPGTTFIPSSPLNVNTTYFWRVRGVPSGATVFGNWSTISTFTTGGNPVNQAPSVNAGPDQIITLPASAQLNGTVTDDGLPNPPGVVTANWTKFSGPGTVTFGNASAKVTTASFSLSGTYVLRLTANDGALSASDDVVITVNPVQTAPTITTSSPLPAGTVNTAYSQTLLATGGTAPYTWSRVLGTLPVGLTLSATGVISGTPSTATTASFQIRVTDVNGQFSEKDFNLTINSTPTEATWEVVGTLPLSDIQSPIHIAIGNGTAYITRNPNRLTVLDLTTTAEIANISFGTFTGSTPGHVAISGNRAYVALSNLGLNGQLAIVNTDNNTVLSYVPVGPDPWGVAVHNNRVYVTNNVWFSNGDPATVKVIDVTNNLIVATIPVGINPNDIAIDPVTGKAYVTNGNSLSKSVSVIDTSTNTVIKTIPMPNEPKGVVIAGGRAYVSNIGVNFPIGTVEVIDIPSDLIIASIPVGRDTVGIAAVSGFVFVANQSSNTVSVIDAASNAVIGTLTVGVNPTGVAVDPATNKVYVTNQSDKTISILAQRQTPAPDLSPPGLAITSHGNGQTVSTNTITVSGTATDAGQGGNGISSVTVNGVRANGDTATGSETANWSRTVTLNQGANTITVIAKDNSPSQNAVANSITINHQPPPVISDPDFTLSPTGSSISIPRGGSGSKTYSVASVNSFGAAVALSLSGQPLGATGGFSLSPATPPANGSVNSTLTITVGVSVACNTYNLTVTGTSGSLTHTANLSLTVTGCGGLKGEYYDNADLTILKLTRIDPTINFDWAAGSPNPSIEPDTFSVRWTGKVQIDHNETYTFSTLTDEGVRLWIDGHLVIDHWQTGAASNNGTMALTAGLHDIKVEFFEETGEAFVQLFWFSPSTPNAIIPQDHLLTPESAGNEPTLSWTGEAGYAADGIDPQSGNTTAAFTYRVKYTDADGDAPMASHPRVHILKGGSEISGSPFAMSGADGSPAEGTIYTFSATLPEGRDYTYYFDAKDATGLQAVAAPGAPTPTAPIDAPDVGDAPPLTGDLDGSGRVDGFDLGSLGPAFGSRPGDPNWNPAVDLNGDGVVDGSDLTLLGSNFGKTR